jgi:BCCT family betaine/carnitine transporter
MKLVNTMNGNHNEHDVEDIPSPEGPSDIIDTEYEIGQDNITPRIGPFGLDIHNPVFMVSGLVTVVVVINKQALNEQDAPQYARLSRIMT